LNYMIVRAMKKQFQNIYELGDKGDQLRVLIDFYEALIPVVYSTNFPKNFRLEPADWFLTFKDVHRGTIEFDTARLRPIGTMDVEFLADEIIDQAQAGNVDLSQQYPCGLKCPGCFSHDSTYADASKFLRWRDVFNVIDDAREIGLKSVKFLGPGELFQNPDLFKILDAAESRRLPLSIFTKGAELGDDELATCVHGKSGICDALSLVKRLAEYSCVRILLGFNSFDPVKQDLMVGSHAVTGRYQYSKGVFLNRGVEKYTQKRNLALLNLISCGFNSPNKGQRLSLIAAPVRLDQILEIPPMYIWAARRNIPLVIAPTMESGPKAIGLMRNDKKKDPYHEKLKEMYVAVYSAAMTAGISDFETICRDGISAYMGTAPCNQVANGLYLRLNGQVQMCPGTSTDDSIFGNVHKKSIVEIWQNSPNYELGALDNNWCRAKRTGMPSNLQSEILAELKLFASQKKNYSPEENFSSAERGTLTKTSTQLIM
jgi:MoaA/NifB/PqqE/SkfB family radical SAM enzyme